MHRSAIVVEPDVIKIFLVEFCRKNYNFENIPFLFDLVSKNYQGQTIQFYGSDGENIVINGALTIIAQLQDMLKIPNDRIEFHTLFSPSEHYRHVALPTARAFSNINDFLQPSDFRNIANAKFVGMLNGSRLSLYRYLMMYELDQNFSGDCFLTFKQPTDAVESYFRFFAGYYQKELEWGLNKKFDVEQMEWPQGQNCFSWPDAASVYHQINNRYQIEVVAETDEFQNCWFTDKTAKVLAAGKPFVLFSGTGSLVQLRKLGFKTFEDVFDEQYDQATTPTYRIKAIINSLKNLYLSHNRQQIIEHMYNIAEQNRQIYLKKYK